MDMPSITYGVGITEQDRRKAVELIDEAFARKLGFAIPDGERRRRVLESGLRLDSVVGAFADGCLVGVVGLKTRGGAAFDGITGGLLWKELGFGAVRAAVLLQLLDSHVEDGTIRIDLIAVDDHMRGRGVGSGLIEAVFQLGCSIGASGVELDVVDTNPDARRLYLRHGFVDRETRTLPFPARWMGFRSSTAMYRELGCPEPDQTTEQAE